MNTGVFYLLIKKKDDFPIPKVKLLMALNGAVCPNVLS